MKNYDLAIIGSGPGGYVAGLYASHNKLSVCVIEKDLVGGTCLNRGCIPTKSLLDCASLISAIRDASVRGVDINGYNINFPTMIARKEKVVARLRSGIETLFKASHVDLARGSAKITSSDIIRVEGAGDISAKNIIIASGSKAAPLANIEIDEADILSSDGILDIKTLPKSLVVIGGGVIGCEFAGLFNTLGVKVSIAELMDRIVPTQSREVSKKLEMVFKKRGIDVLVSSKVEGITKAGKLNVKISGRGAIEAEKVLVAVGRAPDTNGLGDLGRLGIKTEEGRIVVDEYLRTGVSNIYAIGDCVFGPMLAHKASYDAILVCDNILGNMRKIDYSNIPNCIWTDPEVSSVGLCEEEAKAKYADARIAKFPYLASSKACVEGRTEGFIKIIGNKQGDILGVEIFGKEACDLIGEATLAKTVGVNIKDWACVVHGHPTLSEIAQEAARIFCGTAIYTI